MGRDLVLVGGGHSHLGVIHRTKKFTDRGHRLTVISPPFHNYSGMGPGLLSGQYPVEAGRLDIEWLCQNAGARFIEDRVIGVDPNAQRIFTASGASLTYDVLSFNTGSSVRPLAMDEQSAASVFTVKPIENLIRARAAILKQAEHQRTTRVLVVGGGPAGCEVAGNLQALARQQQLQLDITLVAGQGLLHDFSQRTRKLVLSELLRYPLHLHEGAHVTTLCDSVAQLDTHHDLPFDVLIQATGIQPSGPFKDAGLAVGPQGGLSVNGSLRTTLFPEIFAAGDCIFFQPGRLPKVGVYAVRQTPVLTHNLLAALEAQSLQLFRPQKNYLLIFNLGHGRAVATGYGLAWRGRTAALLKTWLDRQFVRRFTPAPASAAR